jgi:hypothetical protein
MTTAPDSRPSRLGAVLGSLWSKVIAPLVVLIAAFYVGIAWAHHEAKPTQTERVLFHPNGYEFPSSLRVTRHTAGTCFANLSIADSGMVEAHRCFAKDGIYDPCWGGPSGLDRQSKVICADDPWSHKVAVLRVTRWEVTTRKQPFVRPWNPDRDRSVVYERANLKAPPWALLLVNGDRCVFATGTAELVANIRFNYRCGKGQALGVPTRRAKLWTIMYLGRESAETQPVQIAKAWF